jgi:protein TonB
MPVALLLAISLLGAGPISQETARPAVLERVAPEYTPEALEAGIEGLVVLETIVRVDGSPEVTRPTRGLPMGLTAKAIEAVEKWTFAPGTINGFPAEMRMNIEVEFVLPGEDETPEVEP